MIGCRFGRLIVQGYSHTDGKRRLHYIVKCDCGKQKIICGANLRKGNSNSCGCLKSEMTIKRNKELYTKHSMCDSKTYRSWQSMKDRCYNVNHQAYKNYGGRNITVCDRWKDSFENFYKDMGDRPEGKTLDRIKINGNYESVNCRWSTIEVQANNMRTNNFLICNGIKLTLSQWARKTKVPRTTIWNRLRRGWEIERALFTV